MSTRSSPYGYGQKGKGGKQSSNALPKGQVTARGHKVFVGNLSFDAGWQDLKDAFRACGDVVRVEILTQGGVEGGRSKGCAIVEFRDAAAAARAVLELHDAEFLGRPLLVRPDAADAGGLTDSRGKGKGGGDHGARLFVGNLAWDVSWQDLKDMFRQVGDVTHVELMTVGGVPGGKSRGCAIVEFRNRNDARKAIAKFQDVNIAGRKMLVREDEAGTGGAGYGGKGGDAADELACRVFVANLDYAVEWQDLKDHMRDVGEVVFADVMTKGGVKGGKSKGCGIVQFATIGAAKRAVTRLHDSVLNSRPILVAPSVEYEDEPSTGGAGYGGKGGDAADELACRVFVANLDYSVQWQELKDHMRDVGEVVFADVMTKGGVKGGKSKGCGVVQFATIGAAKRAVTRLHDSVLNGRPILVAPSVEN